MPEYPKPEPRKKKIKVIRPISDKRLAIEREKVKTYEKVTKDCCEGCGTFHNLSRSHTIGRNQRPDLIAEPKNIRTLCMGQWGCHSHVEQSRFWLLGDVGNEILNDLAEMDYQIFMQKLFRMKDRLNELQIDPKILDLWVEEKLKLLE